MITSKADKHTGKLVQTKLGDGYTKNDDALINGKVPVYLTDGRKVLCNPEKLKVIGYYD